jgi:histone-lysine N-methyltransferase SETD2
MFSPTQDNDAEDPGNDWALPPSPAPEDRLPKRSKLDDFVEVECAIKPLGFSSVRPFNTNSHPHPHRGLPGCEPEFIRIQKMEQAARERFARLERTKAETAAIIAAAAAAQKAAEERALVEAAAAAEEQTKQEERNAERERRRRDRKERERGGKKRDPDREDNREKRLLKLVGGVVVTTMSKYRTRMDVDTFKKHAKEVRGLSSPFHSGLF